MKCLGLGGLGKERNGRGLQEYAVLIGAALPVLSGNGGTSTKMVTTRGLGVIQDAGNK